MSITKKRKDLLLGVFCLVGSSLLIYQSFQYDFKSSYFPRVLVISMAVLSMILLLRAIRSGQEAGLSEKSVGAGASGRKQGLIVAGITVGYVLLIGPLGYGLSTAVYVSLLMFLLGVRTKILIWGPVLSCLLWFVFGRLLGIPLPHGILF